MTEEFSALEPSSTSRRSVVKNCGVGFVFGRIQRCVVKADEELSESVAEGRLEVAMYLVQGIIGKEGDGLRDRVDLSKVRAQNPRMMFR